MTKKARGDKILNTGEEMSEDGCVFTPNDVMIALRYSGEDEDIRFTQLDISRCLRFLSPDERSIILFYAAGYGKREIMRRLNHTGNATREFDKAIKRLTKIMNGDER